MVVGWGGVGWVCVSERDALLSSGPRPLEIAGPTEGVLFNLLFFPLAFPIPLCWSTHASPPVSWSYLAKRAVECMCCLRGISLGLLGAPAIVLPEGAFLYPSRRGRKRFEMEVNGAAAGAGSGGRRTAKGLLIHMQ